MLLGRRGRGGLRQGHFHKMLDQKQLRELYDPRPLLFDPKVDDKDERTLSSSLVDAENSEDLVDENEDSDYVVVEKVMKPSSKYT